MVPMMDAKLSAPKAAQADVEVIAQWSCDWDEQKRDRTCRQQGQPSAPIRMIVAREMLTQAHRAVPEIVPAPRN